MEPLKKEQEIEDLKREINKLKSQLIEPTSKPKNISEEDKTIPTVVKYKWSAPSRIFRRRDNKWFVAIAFVILIFIILFAFLQDLLPIFVLVALMFLVYLLGTVEPENITHEITNKGIYTAQNLYKWNDLKDFWFTKHQDWIKLYVDTNLQFPSRLIMIIKEEESKQVFDILKKDLEYQIIENQNVFSKLNDGEYIKLENYLPKQDLVNTENNLT